MQPAVFLQMAWSAIASQAPLRKLSGLAAQAARAESAIDKHRSKEDIEKRAMVVIESLWKLSSFLNKNKKK